jgi:hypothetical protein
MGSRFLIALLLPVLVACSATGDPPVQTGGTSGAGGTGGAGAGGSGGGGTTCPPDQSYNGSMPAVSLKNDLLADISTDKPAGGLFRRACAASSCHDDQRPEATLFIAPPLRDTMQMPVMVTPDHATRMLAPADGVLRMSQTVPTMPIVDPGKPWNSFLMRKMDGCFTDIASTCTPIGDGPPPCGDEMPATADVLPAAERDLVRRWIFQGARSDF